MVIGRFSLLLFHCHIDLLGAAVLGVDVDLALACAHGFDLSVLAHLRDLLIAGVIAELRGMAQRFLILLVQDEPGLDLRGLARLQLIGAFLYFDGLDVGRILVAASDHMHGPALRQLHRLPLDGPIGYDIVLYLPKKCMPTGIGTEQLSSVSENPIGSTISGQPI